MIPKVGDRVYLNSEFVSVYLKTRGDYWVKPFIGKELEVVRTSSNVDMHGHKINPIFAHHSVRFKIVGTSLNDPVTQCNVGVDLGGRQHGICHPVFEVINSN